VVSNQSAGMDDSFENALSIRAATVAGLRGRVAVALFDNDGHPPGEAGALRRAAG